LWFFLRRLLQEQLLRSRADLLRSGPDVLRSRELLRSRAGFLLCPQDELLPLKLLQIALLQEPLPPQPLLQEQLLQVELLCSRSDVLRSGPDVLRSGSDVRRSDLRRSHGFVLTKCVSYVRVMVSLETITRFLRDQPAPCGFL
jgi:hypothetical protein